MKKMKRILSLVLVLVMVAGLAACGGGGTSGAGSSTPAEPAGSQGSGEGYELTMWLFQDWTVGTAAGRRQGTGCRSVLPFPPHASLQATSPRQTGPTCVL